MEMEKKAFEIIESKSLDSLLGGFMEVSSDELFDLFGGNVYGCTGGAGCPQSQACGLGHCA